MNLWQNENLSDKDAIGGLRNEQAQIRQISQKPEGPSFHPTVMLGLITEVDCFKAIKELGDAKFMLKAEIQRLTATKQENTDMYRKAIAAIEQVHKNQLAIVNDVCKRFGVIHPEIKEPTAYMLEHKTKYWDWYKEQHKKVYGSYPETLG